MAELWATTATPPGGMRGPASRPGISRQALARRGPQKDSSRNAAGTATSAAAVQPTIASAAARSPGGGASSRATRTATSPPSATASAPHGTVPGPAAPTCAHERSRKGSEA